MDRDITYSYKINDEKKYATVSKNEECVLKEWSSNFAQYYWKVDERNALGYATKSTFTHGNKRKFQMSNYMKCTSKKEGVYDHSFLYYSATKYGSPDNESIRSLNDIVRYRGVEDSYKNAARDFSNMMVMDAVIGNDDRFPGGNLHFRGVDGGYSLNHKRHVVFENVRLFSLDNESALRGGSSVGMRDLQTFVTRFDKEFIDKLKLLKRFREIQIIKFYSSEVSLSKL